MAGVVLIQCSHGGLEWNGQTTARTPAHRLAGVHAIFSLNVNNFMEHYATSSRESSFGLGGTIKFPFKDLSLYSDNVSGAVPPPVRRTGLTVQQRKQELRQLLRAEKEKSQVSPLLQYPFIRCDPLVSLFLFLNTDSRIWKMVASYASSVRSPLRTRTLSFCTPRQGSTSFGSKS